MIAWRRALAKAWRALQSTSQAQRQYLFSQRTVDHRGSGYSPRPIIRWYTCFFGIVGWLSMVHDQRHLNHGTRRRRIGDQRAAEAVRGGAEIRRRVLPEQ